MPESIPVGQIAHAYDAHFERACDQWAAIVLSKLLHVQMPAHELIKRLGSSQPPVVFKLEVNGKERRFSEVIEIFVEHMDHAVRQAATDIVPLKLRQAAEKFANLVDELETSAQNTVAPLIGEHTLSMAQIRAELRAEIEAEVREEIRNQSRNTG